ncbi:MAG: MFS transporter [Ilumatobacteraceae bacterium]
MTSAEPDVGGSTLARLTGAKTVANVALRWIPPFLPTLEKAFGATTSQLTTIMGAGEFAGLSTIVVGKHLDRGRERVVMVAALLLVAASAVIATMGSLLTFAVAYFVLVLGVSNLTVAGQAWISHRVDYRWRARAIGLFETSWAIALLVGAPLIAVLINVFGWRGPFVAVAVASVAAAAMVAFTLPAPTRGTPNRVGFAGGDIDADADVAPPRKRTPITSSAWLVMIGSASTAMAGLSVFVISGSWLDDAFGVSTGGIGAVAMAFGAMELVASLSVAGLTDRLGKLRSTIGGLVMVLVGLIVMTSAEQLWLGICGILLFLLGFEFGFVSSLSLVSEAMPDARGATIAISNGVGTVARGGGAIVSGWLYGAYGLTGTACLSAAAAVGAMVAFAISRRVATS